jgi:hypothetical protein
MKSDSKKEYMKKEYMKRLERAIMMAIIMGTGLTACHENLEERTARECREYTEKYCPVPVDVNVVADSMTFERDSKTIHYYYSLRSNADTLLTGEEETAVRKALLSDVINAPNLMHYKEANYNFRYTYYSTKHKGKKLYDYLFTPKDYTMQK